MNGGGLSVTYICDTVVLLLLGFLYGNREKLVEKVRPVIEKEKTRLRDSLPAG